MLDDAEQIRVGRLHKLEDPVEEFHLRVAAHFAKHSRPFERLVCDGVEFSK